MIVLEFFLNLFLFNSIFGLDHRVNSNGYIDSNGPGYTGSSPEQVSYLTTQSNGDLLFSKDIASAGEDTTGSIAAEQTNPLHPLLLAAKNAMLSEKSSQGNNKVTTNSMLGAQTNKVFQHFVNVESPSTSRKNQEMTGRQRNTLLQNAGDETLYSNILSTINREFYHQVVDGKDLLDDEIMYRENHQTPTSTQRSRQHHSNRFQNKQLLARLLQRDNEMLSESEECIFLEAFHKIDSMLLTRYENILNWKRNHMPNTTAEGFQIEIDGLKKFSQVIQLLMPLERNLLDNFIKQTRQIQENQNNKRNEVPVDHEKDMEVNKLMTKISNIDKKSFSSEEIPPFINDLKGVITKLISPVEENSHDENSASHSTVAVVPVNDQIRRKRQLLEPTACYGYSGSNHVSNLEKAIALVTTLAELDKNTKLLQEGFEYELRYRQVADKMSASNKDLVTAESLGTTETKDHSTEDQNTTGEVLSTNQSQEASTNQMKPTEINNQSQGLKQEPTEVQDPLPDSKNQSQGPLSNLLNTTTNKDVSTFKIQQNRIHNLINYLKQASVDLSKSGKKGKQITSVSNVDGNGTSSEDGSSLSAAENKTSSRKKKNEKMGLTLTSNMNDAVNSSTNNDTKTINFLGESVGKIDNHTANVSLSFIGLKNMFVRSDGSQMKNPIANNSTSFNNTSYGCDNGNTSYGCDNGNTSCGCDNGDCKTNSSGKMDDETQKPSQNDNNNGRQKVDQIDNNGTQKAIQNDDNETQKAVENDNNGKQIENRENSDKNHTKLDEMHSKISNVSPVAGNKDGDVSKDLSISQTTGDIRNLTYNKTTFKGKNSNVHQNGTRQENGTAQLIDDISPLNNKSDSKLLGEKSFKNKNKIEVSKSLNATKMPENFTQNKGKQLAAITAASTQQGNYNMEEALENTFKKILKTRNGLKGREKINAVSMRKLQTVLNELKDIRKGLVKNNSKSGSTEDNEKAPIRKKEELIHIIQVDYDEDDSFIRRDKIVKDPLPPQELASSNLTKKQTKNKNQLSISSKQNKQVALKSPSVQTKYPVLAVPFDRHQMNKVTQNQNSFQKKKIFFIPTQQQSQQPQQQRTSAQESPRVWFSSPTYNNPRLSLLNKNQQVFNQKNSQTNGAFNGNQAFKPNNYQTNVYETFNKNKASYKKKQQRFRSNPVLASYNKNQAFDWTNQRNTFFPTVNQRQYQKEWRRMMVPSYQPTAELPYSPQYQQEYRGYQYLAKRSLSEEDIDEVQDPEGKPKMITFSQSSNHKNGLIAAKHLFKQTSNSKGGKKKHGDGKNHHHHHNISFNSILAAWSKQGTMHVTKLRALPTSDFPNQGSVKTATSGQVESLERKYRKNNE